MLKLTIIDKLSPDLHGTNSLFPITYFVLKQTFKALWSCWVFDSLCAHFTNFKLEGMVGAPGKLPRSLSGEHLTYRAAPFKLSSSTVQSHIESLHFGRCLASCGCSTTVGGELRWCKMFPSRMQTLVNLYIYIYYIEHIRNMSRYIIIIVIITVIVIVMVIIRYMICIYI